MPSSRRLDLIFLVVALMPIWSVYLRTVARRSRIVGICGFNFGRSATTTESIFPTASLAPELADYFPQ
jgi:hypothetical protein